MKPSRMNQLVLMILLATGFRAYGDAMAAEAACTPQFFLFKPFVGTVDWAALGKLTRTDWEVQPDLAMEVCIGINDEVLGPLQRYRVSYDAAGQASTRRLMSLAIDDAERAQLADFLFNGVTTGLHLSELGSSLEGVSQGDQAFLVMPVRPFSKYYYAYSPEFQVLDINAIDELNAPRAITCPLDNPPERGARYWPSYTDTFKFGTAEIIAKHCRRPDPLGKGSYSIVYELTIKDDNAALPADKRGSHQYVQKEAAEIMQLWSGHHNCVPGAKVALPWVEYGYVTELDSEADEAVVKDYVHYLGEAVQFLGVRKRFRICG